MRTILMGVITATTFLLASCVNGFQQNYVPVVNTQTASNLELLTEGAAPLVTKADNVRQEVDAAKAAGYIVIGEASFNGEQQSVDNLIAQAKAVRATKVIYSSRYTDTKTVTYTKYVPSSSTTYTSGKYDGKQYKETSTSEKYTPVQEISQERNFDQHAVFLVKAKK